MLHWACTSSLTAPRALAEGNEHAARAGGAGLTDCLLVAARSAPAQLAIESRQGHHRNASTLQKQFGLTRESACQIVKQYHQCQIHLPVPHYGVNPRGLLPNHIGQIDVTRLGSFCHTPYVHTTVDTVQNLFSPPLVLGKGTSHVISHRLQTFAVLGLPKQIEIDNGPG